MHCRASARARAFVGALPLAIVLPSRVTVQYHRTGFEGSGILLPRHASMRQPLWYLAQRERFRRAPYHETEPRTETG